MKTKTSIVPSGLIGILYLLILISCEEAALPINEDGTPLSVDTVSFPVINTVTDQTPTIMGDTEYVYFGQKDDYEFLKHKFVLSLYPSKSLSQFPAQLSPLYTCNI